VSARRFVSLEDALRRQMKSGRVERLTPSERSAMFGKDAPRPDPQPSEQRRSS
jgi:hypothetical protein